MVEPVVRRLGLSDLSELLRLYAQLQPGDPPLSAAVAERTWARIVNDPALIYIGVFVAGKLASTCHAALIPNLTRGARPYAVVENVVTDQAHQRRGFGALAMRELIARCWRADCYKIMLMSGSRRAAVHGFYSALGFDRDAKQAFVLLAPAAN
jgi:GNAT superfamily N-acetyltransferase